MNEEKIIELCKVCGKEINVREEIYHGISSTLGGHNGICCEECYKSNHFHLCSKCDELITENGGEGLNEDWYCDECCKVFFRCDDCGLYIDDADMLETDGYCYLCRDCYENNGYITCEDCGKITDDYEYIESDGTYVCKSCADVNYYYCRECNYWYPFREVYELPNSEYVCHDCFDMYDYCFCSNCGMALSERLVYWHNEKEYCESCYDDLDKVEGLDCIAPYQSTPALDFYRTGNEAWRGLYFGIELEVENRNGESRYLNSVATTARNMLYDNGAGSWATKEDSSLTYGFELASACAFSFEYFNDVAFSGIEKTLNTLVDNDMISDYSSNCGLHIHASKSALNPHIITSLVQIINCYWEPIMVPISRRRGCFRYANKPKALACRYKTKDMFLPGMENDFEGLVSFNGCEYYMSTFEHARYEALGNYSDHGLALNISDNDETVELRLFRGTLNPQSFKAAVHFYMATLEYAKQHEWNEIVNSNHKDYLNYLLNFSPCLKSYTEKRLHLNAPVIEGVTECVA